MILQHLLAALTSNFSSCFRSINRTSDFESAVPSYLISRRRVTGRLSSAALSHQQGKVVSALYLYSQSISDVNNREVSSCAINSETTVSETLQTSLHLSTYHSARRKWFFYSAKWRFEC